MVVNVLRREPGPWFRLAVVVLEPLLLATTRRTWRGAEHLPRRGGVVVVSNHISLVDPLTLAHFVYANGRVPRFLAKQSLFRLPLVGRVMRGAGQIPVLRGSRDARAAYAVAVEAVRRGEAVLFYPEGTLTRDPGLWPMVGRTGAARVALETGAPVVPVAQWGPQRLLAPYSARLRLFPRTRVAVLAGEPVDLARFRGRESEPEILHEATEEIMAAVTRLLVLLRGEAAPAQRFDPRRPAPAGPPAAGGRP